MSLARPIRLGSRSKYFAKHTRVDGIRFDSAAEARRYSQLKLLLKLGEITDLERQPVYELHVTSLITGERKKIGYYRADFLYKTASGDTITEDLKSPPTKTSYYRLKKRMVEAQYGIRITEVTA
jgi:hypothetical protein